MGKSKDLATGNSAAYVETAGDTMSGNLGIGVAPSSSPLHVVGSSSGGFLGGGIRINDTNHSSDFFIGGGGTGSLQIASAAGATRMVIDGSGRVTMPYQPQFVFQGSYNAWTTISQSGVWLPLTGSTGVATSTNNELAMNWTSSRIGGYNLSGNGINANTGVYTAPVAGLYMFTFQSYILKNSTGTGYIHINGYINGTNMSDYTIYGYNSASTYVTPEITKVIRLSANDTFAFRLYTNVTDYQIFPHYTCLTGSLLG